MLKIPTNPTLWLAGSAAWPAPRRMARLIAALRDRGVTRLADVRLNPSSANPVAGSPYGPKPWNLQVAGHGLVAALADAGIAYDWFVELGNPQRRDRGMVILREHLADPDGGWPVHRGLDRLAERVATPGESVALLCACPTAATCHRLVVARALANTRLAAGLVLRDLKTGDEIGLATG